MPPKVEIFTYGAGKKKRGSGGWAALVKSDAFTEYPVSGSESDTTKQRMELTAAIEALKSLKQRCEVTLFSDSDYLIKIIVDEWIYKWRNTEWKNAKKQDLANQDLLNKLFFLSQPSLIKKLHHKVQWLLYDGSYGAAEYEIVEKLANEETQSSSQRIDAVTPILKEEPLTKTEPEPETIEIFIGGSCSGNRGPGGWAALAVFDDWEIPVSGGEPGTTNNRMELTAAVKALEGCVPPAKLVMYTDSKYVKEGITEWIKKWKKNGWKTADGKPVKNKELWQRLDKLRSQYEIEWIWEKAGDRGREYEIVDRLAKDEEKAQKFAGDKVIRY